MCSSRAASGRPATPRPPEVLEGIERERASACDRKRRWLCCCARACACGGVCVCGHGGQPSAAGREVARSVAGRRRRGVTCAVCCDASWRVGPCTFKEASASKHTRADPSWGYRQLPTHTRCLEPNVPGVICAGRPVATAHALGSWGGARARRRDAASERAGGSRGAAPTASRPCASGRTRRSSAACRPWTRSGCRCRHPWS